MLSSCDKKEVITNNTLAQKNAFVLNDTMANRIELADANTEKCAVCLP